MNHIYRNIWNATTGTWAAVAENATAHGKSARGSVRRAELDEQDAGHVGATACVFAMRDRERA